MLVDKTLSSAFDYTYELVQVKTFSGETFNAGIILVDSSGEVYTFFANVKNKKGCIKIKDTDSINFLLGEVKEELFSQTFSIRDYTDISITRPVVFTSEKEPEAALDELTNKYITIKSFISSMHKELSIYDKRKIHKTLTSYAKEIGVDNFKAGKHFNIAYKAIDMALLDAKELPYSIATMTSPHVDNFKDSFITNIFTLQEAVKKSSSLKSKFLYAPVFENICNQNNKILTENLGWAKEQAQEYSFDLLTDYRESAVFEKLKV